jgi:hypothetical protein
MAAQPGFGDVRGAARDHIDPLASFSVDEHGGVAAAAAAAQREVVDPEQGVSDGRLCRTFGGDRRVVCVTVS